MNLILTRAKKVTSQLFLLRPQLDYVQIASLQFYTISYTKCVTRDDNLQYVVLQGILNTPSYRVEKSFPTFLERSLSEIVLYILPYPVL